jgi:hypothetical protein
MVPDVLVMSATPIPRILAMMVYGDLDISVIDELPPGKKAIRTKVFFETQRNRIYGIMRHEVQKGNQVFIVYPLIERSDYPIFGYPNIMRDCRILSDARTDAFALMNDDPCLDRPVHIPIREVLDQRWGDRLDLVKTE